MVGVNYFCGQTYTIYDESIINQLPRSVQTKDYRNHICCFSTKHAAIWRKRKDWLARNQDDVSEWGGMSIRGLLFQ
jgi:hypothetical protein